MNSADVSTLKKELDRFAPKPCRTCQFVLGFGVLVFLISLTLFLFAYKGVPPQKIYPVESVPRDTPLTRTDEKVVLDDLRAFAQTHVQPTEVPKEEQEAHEKTVDIHKNAKIVVDPIP